MKKKDIIIELITDAIIVIFTSLFTCMLMSVIYD